MLVSGMVSSSIWREGLWGEAERELEVEREERRGWDSRTDESAEWVVGDMLEVEERVYWCIIFMC